jgi:hypothetical protein
MIDASLPSVVTAPPATAASPRSPTRRGTPPRGGAWSTGACPGSATPGEPPTLARHDDERAGAERVPHNALSIAPATWSATAMMVIMGFTPLGAGNVLPSAT